MLYKLVKTVDFFERVTPSMQHQMFIKMSYPLFSLLNVDAVTDESTFFLLGGIPRNLPAVDEAGEQVGKRTTLFRTVSYVACHSRVVK